MSVIIDKFTKKIDFSFRSSLLKMNFSKKKSHNSPNSLYNDKLIIPLKL